MNAPSIPDLRQIIPATGYFAVYAVREGEETREFYEPVVAWALVLHRDRFGRAVDRWHAMEGLSAGAEGVARIEEAANFVGYCREDERGGANVAAWVEEYFKHNPR